MDKLKKLGLTAIAGTFAIGSAQALEMSASGSAGFTYSSSDDDDGNNEHDWNPPDLPELNFGTM